MDAFGRFENFLNHLDLQSLLDDESSEPTLSAVQPDAEDGKQGKESVTQGNPQNSSSSVAK